jgi:hypothetical protein
VLTFSSSSSLPFYLSANNVFWTEVPTQDATNPVGLLSLHRTNDVHSLTLCPTSSIFIRSVQLIAIHS